ncbi:MAG TPA: 2-hydroxyhepta-2,4-diene-1,7-dioate isomerase [Verrucomicrobiales bacterium]|nr:2-hydroxyhepta-2,4-diene-1,7-dioate isomerase [Verrucomicrobiales bacterium]
MFLLYRTPSGIQLAHEQTRRDVVLCIDDVFRSSEPLAVLQQAWEKGENSAEKPPHLLAPVGSQEVWAAGVTYYRSRTARMEESEQAGGERFYDLVYDAARPELFFKATARRLQNPGGAVGIRSDSTWNVPEPELTLAINREGMVFGATIGNDMSSRSIEGENPLYLPQAKVYTGSASLGPCLLVGDLPGPETEINLSISRNGEEAFHGTTTLSQLKRSYEELAGFLFQENDFPDGALLMTGTGIVPDHPFTLQPGDIIRISISGIGTLENTVSLAGDIQPSR